MNDTKSDNYSKAYHFNQNNVGFSIPYHWKVSLMTLCKAATSTQLERALRRPWSAQNFWQPFTKQWQKAHKLGLKNYLQIDFILL